ncbi:MAG: hypothetical protein ACKOGP_11160 [Bacteroidota bacterium]
MAVAVPVAGRGRRSAALFTCHKSLVTLRPIVIGPIVIGQAQGGACYLFNSASRSD